MKLDQARLCIDCDEVIEGYKCPVCGGDYTWPIISWLNHNPAGVTKCDKGREDRNVPAN